MKATLVQPPFVQLNAPYPAIHYLEAFLRKEGVEAAAHDHSIALYRSVFSREGLEPVFAETERGLAEGRLAADDGNARSELERYLSYRPLYLEWIEGIVAFLSGEDPGFAHRIGSAAELPRGARAQAFLDERDGLCGPDEARALATRILDDLGDLVTYAYDSEFGTVRYGERIASSCADFGPVRAALGSSRLMNAHYGPLLDAFWKGPGAGTDLLLVSIPFPGCLVGALACARAAREVLGPALRVAFGGGYVSTELRSLSDAGIFDFCDYLAFDAGYGGVAAILEAMRVPEVERRPPYLCMIRGENGRVMRSSILRTEGSRGEKPGDNSARADRGFEDASPEDARFAGLEREAVVSTFPDYRDAKFSDYIRVVDSTNPMHRLWSDTPWLKYHLARGCYWRRCSFCDTELEYVAEFSPSRVEALLTAASAAAARAGLYGIHFVDEAMPMKGLLEFATANRKKARGGERAFHFWGNARFDASWTRGRCEYLAASGLVAVSGGIEIATERGLEMTDKGFDLAGLVKCLVAMKRNGILVHAYLIYGFPGQAEADIVDSAEAVRQLFASGLVDSAFWHRFVLTRHSRMHAKWREGAMPDLHPVGRPRSFADNDLSFEGEEGFDRYEEPLASSLASWMAGEGLEKRASSWFGKGARPSRLSPDLLESLIARAEAAMEVEVVAPSAKLAWIGGQPIVVAAPTLPAAPSNGKPSRAMRRVTWAYRGSTESILVAETVARRLVAAIEKLRNGQGAASSPYRDFCESAAIDPSGPEAELLLGAGLVRL